MTDIIYCPRKSCQYPVSREGDEVMASCPVCQYVFCIFCKMTYHGIEPCKVNTGNIRLVHFIFMINIIEPLLQKRNKS